ncbi:phosphoenolpyruvate--protein phosphotransferase [bacterium]|nr:MAG: phosphoenolpyruvate--protein phosphotransferase [bacterium]
MTENKELILLEEISFTIAETKEIQKALERVVELISTRLRVDVVSIFFFEEGELVLKATRGLLPLALKKVRMTPWEGLTGLTFRQNAPVNVEDAGSHPDFKYFDGISENALSSFLGIPVLYFGNPIGVLSLQTKERRFFTPDEVRMLVAVAGQLSGVMASAMLSAKTASHAKRPSPRAEQPGFLKGTPASPGFGRGRLLIMKEKMDLDAMGECPCASVEEGLGRFEEAMEKAEGDIAALRDKVSGALSEADGEIFHAHLLMLQDKGLRDKVKSRISEGEGPVRAVVGVAHEYIDAFLAMEDTFLRDRAADIRDLAHRIIGHLMMEEAQKPKSFQEPTIVLASDTTPSQIAALIQPGLKGVALTQSGLNSHAVILCRAAGVPAIVGIDGDLNGLEEVRSAILDGNTGMLYLEPGEAVSEEYERLEKEMQSAGAKLRAHLKKPSRTKDGEYITLKGNAALLSDAPRIKERGAEGIGLYRTEFPFLVRQDLPSEQAQYEVYSRAVKIMQGLPVTFRTLDIGGDKPLPYLPLGHEENPQMGFRSLRMSFGLKEVFCEQVRAMLRASAHGPVNILFPMVTDLAELQWALEIVEEEKKKTGRDSAGNVSVGAMIEVPAAAIMFDKLLPFADFFSIGTNDLTQYLLAVDRGNRKVAHIYDPMHPAVLRTLWDLSKRAKKAKKPLSVCGELAATPVGAAALLALGYTEISVTPSAILKIRRFIQCVNASELVKIRGKLLRAGSAPETKEIIQKALRAQSLPETLLL